MSELDDIKARAAERRIRRERYSTLGNPELATEAEADLDRAIAIAEDRGANRDHWYEQNKKAIAAVLKLRKVISDPGTWHDPKATRIFRALAETESYEQYRTHPT